MLTSSHAVYYSSATHFGTTASIGQCIPTILASVYSTASIRTGHEKKDDDSFLCVLCYAGFYVKGEWLYLRRRRNKERVFRFSVNSNPSRVILPPKQGLSKLPRYESNERRMPNVCYLRYEWMMLLDNCCIGVGWHFLRIASLANATSQCH